MGINKHYMKSKTNWVQVPFVALLMSSLQIPAIQKVICEEGHFVIGAQVILTLVARNWNGQLRFGRNNATKK